MTITRKLIFFFIFLITIFLVNIVFYFVSDDYNFFIKKLKDSDEIIDSNEMVITDESFNDKKNDEIETKVKVIKKNEVKLINEVVLGKNYNEILNLFSILGLKQLEINSNLFDITDEYPDDYYEYYSDNLTLYLFHTKTYTDIKDFFYYLESELPFKANEINNFGDKSFYINLNDNISDNYVRIVIFNKGIVFGIKVKKNKYPLVKEKLETLKIN